MGLMEMKEGERKWVVKGERNGEEIEREERAKWKNAMGDEFQ